MGKSMVSTSDKRVQYEGRGVFLGLISYPYYLDGKELYQKVFDPFFEEHKMQILKYDPDVNNIKDYGSIYKPAGYRIFGSKGLAVLSLVDDYSFYNRFFNKNHIQSLLEKREEEIEGSQGRKKAGNEWDDYLKFKSEVVSGVVEYREGDRALEDTAESTFLEEADPYKFIGIARLKINYDILKGNGVEAVWKIKERVDVLSKTGFITKRGQKFDYFVMDCYDNDEMTIIAFSDDLMVLYNFLGDIRSIKNGDIGQEYKDRETGEPKEKHVFGLSYFCFGYKVVLRDGEIEDFNFDDIDKRFWVNCAAETKPGHRDKFYKELYESNEVKKKLEIDEISLNTNISGGSSVCFSFPLSKISFFEELCRDNGGFIRRDVRNLKVSLKDIIDANERSKSEIADNHIQTADKSEEAIPRSCFKEIKVVMKKAGVSKMVRERLLTLMEFYNLSYQNILQRAHLDELKLAFLNVKKIIEEMMRDTNESVSSIEKMLNGEITDLENACYDRLHIQKGGYVPLEYSGGIQQYLTSFDFAYKQIYGGIFSPNDVKAYYVTISGAERASSKRTIFNMNINDIIFPEMFIVLVWKEIANFALKPQNEFDNFASSDKDVKDRVASMNAWNRIISKAKTFSVIQERFDHSEKRLYDDEVWRLVKKLLAPKLIEYYIKDCIVFHFAFNRSYNLFWHYYFKIFFQTTEVYGRLNHVDKKYLIEMLLRVFMIAKIFPNDDTEKFLKEKKSSPFDSIVGAQWEECYQKTMDATDEIYNIIQMFGFEKMIEESIQSYEGNVFSKDNPEKDEYDSPIIPRIVKKRESQIEGILDNLINSTLIQKNGLDNFSFLICLFGAYLRAVFLLDNASRKGDSCIKCVPRDREGEINSVMGTNGNEKISLHEDMINVLVDTTGGFFVPAFKIRKAYFALRTTFYRTLWNYCFVTGNRKK